MQHLRHHTARRRKAGQLAAASVLVLGLTLAGCTTSTREAAPPSPSSETGDELLAAHDLAGLDAAQIVDQLDAMPVADRPADLGASVRPDELVLTAGQDQETALPMPADVVYVSLAPFEETTHECYYHSLTTCVGELSNVEVQVTLVDDASGEVLVDEPMQTFDNGFVGLWVPRDIEASLVIARDGRTGSATVSTRNDDDPTCITTLQLT